MEGATDAQGVFRFPVPKTAREKGHDLIVRINAGEGHQGETRILAASLGEYAESEAASAMENSQSVSAAAAHLVQAGQPVLVQPQELEQIINTALEQKLMPIRQMLAEQAATGPSWRDIIGGIGWIVGLAGLAAYFKSRRA
jgi:nickel transport protein